MQCGAISTHLVLHIQVMQINSFYIKILSLASTIIIDKGSLI